ncbi:hypothetical protein QWY28_08515 [Nocardioides sp. SOB77]|uniref:DUF222 domain-containing protein n=1 Tax=Nocardioides oceani TaxID=3058369 RepID=A0ABT8FEX9_9ACTN|nr:hypothetical protein [Nocardioides oceani]MDN4172980.1 hypothetical protein [Nocardioides oceani]
MSDEQRPGDAAGPDGEDVGSVAEEAAKLFGALGDWAQDQGDGLGAGFSGFAAQAAAAAHGLDEHLATGAPECTWCPVCRAVQAVRRTSPEVRAHLTAAASSLLQAAAEAMATAVPQDRRPPPDAGTRVERIDLDPDTGTDEWPEDEE